MWENLNVNGFHFDSAAEYAEAKHEAEIIQYLRDKMDINDPQIAFKVYIKLLERQNLHTVIGISFLKELRDRIVESGIIEDSELKYIHAPQCSFEKAGTLETGDENALETDNAADEFSSDVNLPDNNNGNSDSLKLLNRDLQASKKNEKKMRSVADYYRFKTKQAYIIIGALVLMIIIFFGITVYRGDLNMDSKELEIQDKYAQWDEELKQREAELNAREQALNE